MTSHNLEAEEFLAHYGVKGMRWGTRKSTTSSAPKPKKTPAQKAKDKKIRAARIEKAKLWTSRAILAATVVATIAPSVGHLAGVGMDTVIMNKNASNAAKSAANAFADSRGLYAMRIIDI